MRYLFLWSLLLFVGCAQAPHGPVLPPAATVAVAGFICPQYDWELMAGVVPEEPVHVETTSLKALDAEVNAYMSKRGASFLSPAAVSACEETVIASKERRRLETVEYWTQVGTCLGTEYILVPYVTGWRQRDGGDYGVKSPASVTLDFYLVQVATGQVLRAHFEEEQQGLAENLLSGKRFAKRKGRWLTPEELAAEGIVEGLRELGL